MSAAKQAGISLNRAMAIAAKATRNALKPEIRVQVEKRGKCDAKAIRYENGQASEPKFLNK